MEHIRELTLVYNLSGQAGFAWQPAKPEKYQNFPCPLNLQCLPLTFSLFPYPFSILPWLSYFIQ
jgi:hypothetical protein